MNRLDGRKTRETATMYKTLFGLGSVVAKGGWLWQLGPKRGVKLLAAQKFAQVEI